MALDLDFAVSSFFCLPFNQGWIECVGCADRSCYDLQKHEEFTKKGLFAQDKLAEPRTVETTVIDANMGFIGKTFKTKGKAIKEHLDKLSQDEAKKLGETLKANGWVPNRTPDHT